MKTPMTMLVLLVLLVVGCRHEESHESVDTSAGDQSMSENNDKKVSESDAKKVSEAGYDVSRLSADKVKELTKDLTPLEYQVTCQQGTEPPNSGDLLSNKKTGTYTCRVCGLPLFSSVTKFKSGTGWPSFYTPFDSAHVRDIRDTSHGMIRVENRCARCDAHLGHVFDDGPAPTGLRYCINSASLDFTPADEELPARSRPDAK